jgi:hypothetical protein
MRRCPRRLLWLLPPVWLGFLYGLWQRRASLPGAWLALRAVAWVGLWLFVWMAVLSPWLAPPAPAPTGSQQTPQEITTTGILTATGTGIITATSQRPGVPFVGTDLVFGTTAVTCTGEARLRVTPTGLSCESGAPGRE